MITLGQIDQLDYLDKLIQVFGNLLDNPVITYRGQGQTRQGRIFGGRDGQGFDVVITLRKQTHYARQGAGFVFHQNRKDMSHDQVLSVLFNHMSRIDARGTCIG